jgi:hypothetical protein
LLAIHVSLPAIDISLAVPNASMIALIVPQTATDFQDIATTIVVNWSPRSASASVLRPLFPWERRHPCRLLRRKAAHYFLLRQ